MLKKGAVSVSIEKSGISKVTVKVAAGIMRKTWNITQHEATSWAVFLRTVAAALDK